MNPNIESRVSDLLLTWLFANVIVDCQAKVRNWRSLFDEKQPAFNLRIGEMKGRHLRHRWCTSMSSKTRLSSNQSRKGYWSNRRRENLQDFALQTDLGCEASTWRARFPHSCPDLTLRTGSAGSRLHPSPPHSCHQIFPSVRGSCCRSTHLTEVDIRGWWSSTTPGMFKRSQI